MDEKTNNDSDKSTSVDADFMLPGFRFHPTDEELVEFYLKRKLQHRPLAIELIKQVDIYKYDPWDLPKLASTGEKEWYFYCPRDRKYRNSTRPNRVTGSGFWKATGTDRPIYSSDGGKCIGLKKSLVFYRGRAAKGMKTDWMMHEFRLPSATDGGPPPPPPPPPPQPHKKIFDKSLPPNDSWAICRIFKKNNSTANRALTHAWTPSLSDTTTTSSDAFPYTNFNDFQQSNIFSSAPNIPSYRTTLTSANNGDYFTGNLVFSPPEEASGSNKLTTVDLTTTTFFDQSTGKNSDQQHQFNSGYSVIDGEDDQEGFRKNSNIHHMWENIRSMGFPFSLPQESWKPNLPWESPPCPSEISSTTYSTNKCYI